jgi:hypothetical protein
MNLRDKFIFASRAFRLALEPFQPPTNGYIQYYPVGIGDIAAGA